MKASAQIHHRSHRSFIGMWHGPESPKAFLGYLRSAPSYFHMAIAGGLREAGFQIRYVRKRANHNVWNTYLLRGAVPSGAEAETARQAVSMTLGLCGAECSKKEIEVAVIGSTVGAAFTFEGGAPGTLVLSKGRESWCADEWP